MADPRATVVILTFNGETYLQELLDALDAQVFDGGFEVLVIDSGSSDRTLEILRAHPRLELVEIPNSDFGHGRTRDLAARRARGELVAFLTQDAVPANPHWLAELLAPFEIDERVALVTGRQVPRGRAFPLQKYEIIRAFRALGPDGATTLHGGWIAPATESQRDLAAFNSDVNAAVRRSRATTDLPFRDVPYAEDQMMGRDVIGAGAIKAYAGRATVVHSNDLTLAEYGRRIFDETVGLRRIGTAVAPLSFRACVLFTARGILGDSLRIVRDRGFGTGARLRWLLVNPAFHVTKWVAYRRASRVDLADDDRISASSLEARRKTG